MRFVRGFFARHHTLSDTSSPSGYVIGSGYSDGYVRLVDQLNRDLPKTPLTPELLSKAMSGATKRKRTPQPKAAIKSGRVRVKGI